MSEETVVAVIVHNPQDDVRTDTGKTRLQMGQRLWRSFVAEARYTVEHYEASGLPGNLQEWVSHPDTLEQCAAWVFAVPSGDLAALKERLDQLAASPPYRLPLLPSVMRMEPV